jgi:hypothetical protein
MLPLEMIATLELEFASVMGPLIVAFPFTNTVPFPLNVPEIETLLAEQ